MSKELPIRMPMLQTYQSSSFVLGVAMAHDNLKNNYLNNYANLYCFDVDKLEDLGIRFVGDMWEEYRLAGMAEMDLFHVKNIDRSMFKGFIKERVDQDNYILLYEIDDYFLSYSASYCKKHYIHDTYIYGYNENEFLVMAYKDKKLQMITVPDEEIVDGVYEAFKNNTNLHFCTFRPFHKQFVNLDKNLFVNNLVGYFKKTDYLQDGYVYGIRVNDALVKSLKLFMNRTSPRKELDLRPFRVLWEHKCSLLESFKVFEDSLSISNDCIELLNDIERTANKTFRLAIKYNMTFKQEYLEKIIGYIEENVRKEWLLYRGLSHQFESVAMCE